MSQYALYTCFTTLSHKADALAAILVKANNIVSVANGCRLFIINRDTKNPDDTWVTELWDSQEDHAISLTLDGCKELMLEAAHLLATEPKQIVLKPLAGKGVEE